MGDRPYIIRRDGTVVDRKSGEVVGRVVCRDLFHRRWTALRPDGSTRDVGAPRRREAADALWAEHERRRKP